MTDQKLELRLKLPLMNNTNVLDMSADVQPRLKFLCTHCVTSRFVVCNLKDHGFVGILSTIVLLVLNHIVFKMSWRRRCLLSAFTCFLLHEEEVVR